MTPTTTKCTYCDKEITEKNGTNTCSLNCMEEVYYRKYSGVNEQTSLDELIEHWVSSLLYIWATSKGAEYPEQIIVNQNALMRLRHACKMAGGMPMWGVVLREAGRRRFGQ